MNLPGDSSYELTRRQPLSEVVLDALPHHRRVAVVVLKYTVPENIIGEIACTHRVGGNRKSS